VWGLIVSVALYVGVSFFTSAPESKANEFIDYVNGALKEKDAS
jgi:SSS family solute:Na+ symporter